MLKQDIANKKQQIAQLEVLIKQENNSFLLNNYKNALELRNNELQELKNKQREYELGTFDIYEHTRQEALKGFISYANTQRWNQTQKNDFFSKSMKKWEQEHIELKYASLLRKVFYRAFCIRHQATKIQSTQKVLKGIESLQDFLKQDVERQYL